MALYTVDDAIDVVKILIEEANDTNIITEDDLITLVSDAQKWVAAQAGCYQAWSDITLTPATVDYDPPAGTSGLLGARYDYGTNIGYRNLKNVDPLDTPPVPDFKYPYYWFYRGNKITIYPSFVNSTALPTNTTVNILAALVPDALTALSDSLVIPDEFQLIVPYFVAKNVAIKDNQLEKMQLLTMEVERLTKVGMAQYAHQTPGVGPQGISS